MIRKMLVIAAAVAMPAASIAGISAVAASGVAGASGPVVHASTCALSGNVTFATPGTKQQANVSTGTTTTSTTHLTSIANAGVCYGQATAVVTPIKQPALTCASTSLKPLPPSAGALAGLTPGYTQFSGCTAHPTDHQYGSAWGFLGGVAKNGVLQSTTGGIKKALAAGVKYKDNGVALVLLVSTVSAIQPGGACGASDPGCGLVGTVKSAVPSVAWHLNLCLAGDTGAGTTNNFLNDLLTEVGDTHTNTPDSITIATTISDATESTLVIN